MDNWIRERNENGTPWRRYLVVGILAAIALAVAVAYAVSRFAPSH